jgi:hypothetical protein
MSIFGLARLLVLSIHVIQWALTLASVLDNVEERCGCLHLAYLDVLSMRNLLPFAGGLFDSSVPM